MQLSSIAVGHTLVAALALAFAACSWAEHTAAVTRQFRYCIAVKNELPRLRRRVTVSMFAPARRTANQQTVDIRSPRPFTTKTDRSGNCSLEFELTDLAPFGRQLIHLHATVRMQGKGTGHQSFRHVRQWLEPSPLIECNHPELTACSAKFHGLPAETLVRTVNRYVKGTVQTRPYRAAAHGALWTLRNRRGDCTEHAYLLAALCRAGKLPARVVGGFVIDRPRRLQGHEYHNWAEVLVDGQWRVADPMNGRCLQNEDQYIVFRYLDETPTSAERWSVRPREGVTVQWLP